MRENRTSGLMRGRWKRSHGADCDTGSGTIRKRKPPETVKPCTYHHRASALLYPSTGFGHRQDRHVKRAKKRIDETRGV